MRILQSNILRAVCAIIVGVLLVRCPDATLVGLTIAIGVLFLISGVFSVVAYMVVKHRVKNTVVYDEAGNEVTPRSPMFPVVGVGSILLGLLLALMPATFVSFLMYFLGAILILGGLSQMFSLISASRQLSISWVFYIFPIIIFLTGLFVLLKPMESATLPLLIIGWAMIVYGVVECVNCIKLHIAMKKLEKQRAATEAEVVSAETIVDDIDEASAQPAEDQEEKADR